MPDVSNRPRDSKNAQPSTNGRRYLGSMAAFLRHLFVSRDGYDEARQIAFQHFVLDFHEVPLPPSDPEKALYERVAAVIRTTHDFSLTWEQLFDYEATLLRLIPETSLRRRIWRLREEFQRLATAELYDSYMKSNPPSPDSGPIEQVRADAAFVMEEIQRLRIGRVRMEGIRAWLTVVTLLLAALSITAGAFVWGVKDPKANEPPTLAFAFKVPAAVAVAGIAGSFFSLMGRLYSIPVKGDLIDRSPSRSRKFLWLISPFLSATQGAVAALTLFFLLRAGIQGQLAIFPQWSDPKLPLWEGPGLPADQAKIVIWAFIAGFSERLVPDMLTQLADKASARQTPKA